MTDQASDQDLSELTAGVHALVPILGAMGLEVLQSETGVAAAKLPAGPNVNHFGVTYAGSLFSVAEMLGGLMGSSSFDVPGAIPIVKRLEIDFTRPASTDVVARATMAADEIARVQAEASEHGKAEFELLAEVTDEAGTVVARTYGFYQLRVMS